MDNQINPYSIILRPLVTEKSTALSAANKYIFEVDMRAPAGRQLGATVQAGVGSDIRTGNALPLRNMPNGTVVHNIELVVGRGGQIVRSAGASAQLMAKEEDYCLLRLPSGEMRRVP